MPTFICHAASFVLVFAFLDGFSVARAQGTSFSYQGQLTEGSTPAKGSYDFAFSLFGVSSGGNAIAGPIIKSAAGVTNGLFSVTLDFGNHFPGADRWLEISVRTNGGGQFTTLNPRQPITASPYAIQSANAASATSVSGSVSTSQLIGTISSNNIAAGTISGAMLASGAVGSNQLATGAVTTTVLANGAVTAAKVATASNWFALTIANPTPEPNDEFGYSVAAMGSDRVLIGGWGDNTGANRAGAAYLFSINGTLLTTFTNPAPQDSDFFGWSVAAVGGDRVLIGAPGDDTGATGSGVVYLLSTNRALITTLTNPTPANSDNFGSVMAVLGTDRVLIGVPDDDTGATDAGVAYLFSTNGALLTTFTNPTPVASDNFGSSVAAVGTDGVLIGTPFDGIGGFHPGAAYLFSTNGTLITTFTNPTPANTDQFGASVAALGSDRIVIGAPSDDTAAGQAGAAYLFSIDGTLLTTFLKPIPTSFTSLGRSVAAVGTDRVLIGASSDDTGANDAGAAYLFSTNGALLTTFTNPTPVASDNFPRSIAVVGSDRILFGASSDDTGASNTGAAYLFSVETFTSGLVAQAVAPRSITTASLEDGAVTAAKIGGVLSPSQIPNLDAAKITSGTLSDARLSTNVSLLGSSIESGEIADGTISNADISTSAAIADGKLATISTAGKVADTALSANVALLNRGIQSFTGSTNTFSGRVGINTISPVADLHVNGPIVIQGALTPNSASSSNLINLMVGGSLPVATNGSLNGVSFYESAGAKAMSLGYDGSGAGSANALRLYNGSNAPLVSFQFGGNVGIGTTTPTTLLHVRDAGNTEISVESSDAAGHRWTLQSSAVSGSASLDGSFQVIDRTAGGARLLIGTNGNVGIGTSNPTNRLHVAGGVSGTAFVSTSDRNAKENFEPVSARDVLAKVIALPITTWNFKELHNGRHIGPMAQDFYAAFHLGNSDTTITSVDPDGVALAAIQGLNQKLEETRAELKRRDAENRDLKERLEKVERLLSGKLNDRGK